MSISEKIKRAFNKMKSGIIVYLIIMIVIWVIGVAPITMSFNEATLAAEAGDEWSAVFFTQIANNIRQPLTSLVNCFEADTVQFLKVTLYYIFISFIFFRNRCY